MINGLLDFIATTHLPYMEWKAFYLATISEVCEGGAAERVLFGPTSRCCPRGRVPTCMYVATHFAC